MGKNEKTSKRIGSIASKVLKGQKVPQKDLKSLAGSVLTQRPDRGKSRKK